MAKKEWSIEELDEVVDNTTAFRSFGALVEAMRGNDGYGQTYTPTLRPEVVGEFEEGLHAVRAEAQRLGFHVFPDDGFYEKRSDIEEIGDGYEAPPLDDLVFVQEGPDELEAAGEPEEPDAYELDI